MTFALHKLAEGSNEHKAHPAIEIGRLWLYKLLGSTTMANAYAHPISVFVHFKFKQSANRRTTATKILSLQNQNKAKGT